MPRVTVFCRNPSGGAERDHFLAGGRAPTARAHCQESSRLISPDPSCSMILITIAMSKFGQRSRSHAPSTVVVVPSKRMTVIVIR